VALGAHAVVIMDQAGWHMTDALIIPEKAYPLLSGSTGCSFTGLVDL
jgi:hypothetical protein